MVEEKKGETEVQKECFIICPIGEDGTETRERSDKLLRHLFEPVAKICQYQAVRADKISQPGIITRQIIDKLLESPLVIADLTDQNPNVLYELAIRHATRKPLVQIIKKGQSLPFDIAVTRVIQVDHQDLDSVAEGKTELEKQIRAVEANPADYDNPISTTIELQKLHEGGDVVKEGILEILGQLHELSYRMSLLEHRIKAVDQNTKALFNWPFREISWAEILNRPNNPNWKDVSDYLGSCLKKLQEGSTKDQSENK